MQDTTDETAPDSLGEPRTPEHPGPSTGAGWIVGGLLLLGLALCLVAAQRGFRSAPSGLIAGDFSALELRVLLAWRHPLLVGPYSRLGFHHPGPMLYYVLAPLYRLVGGSVVGMLFASTVVHVVCFGLALVVAFRRGGLRLMVLAGVLLAVLLTAFWPWHGNPSNPLLSMSAFLVVAMASWAVAECDVVWAPVAAAFGALAVQSHIGAAAPTAALTGGACVVVVVRALRNRHDAPQLFRRTIWWLAGAAVLSVVLWLPPLVQQFLTHQPGNVHRIVSHLRSGSGYPGPTAATRAILGALRLDADWIVGTRARASITARITTLDTHIGIPIVPIAFVVAGVYAWRARLRTRTLFVLLALGLGAAWVALLRLEAPYYPYLYLWLPVLALLTWFAILGTALTVVAEPGHDRRVRACAVVVLVVGAVALARPAVDLLADAIGWAAVGAGVVVVIGTAAGAWYRGPVERRAGRTAVCAGVAVVLLAGVGAMVRSRDAGPYPVIAHTRSERRMLALADAMARAVPSGSGAVDITWDGKVRELSLIEVAAAAIARDGNDVVLPQGTQGAFGPEIVGAPDPRHRQVRIQSSAAPPPNGAAPIGTWNGATAYLVPGR